MPARKKIRTRQAQEKPFRRDRKGRALQEIGATVIAGGKGPAVVEEIAELVQRTCKYRWVGVYKIQRKDFVIEAATNKMRPACPRFPVTQGLSARAAEERRTVTVPDVRKEPCFLPNFWSTKSEIVVPIIDDEHDRVLGVINVESAKVNAFDKSDRDFLEGVARIIWPASKESGRAFDSLLAGQVSRIGQVELSSSGGEFALYHRDDVGRTDLRQHQLAAASEIVKFDDSGDYRPLKTAPTLRHGWKIFANNCEEVSLAIDAIYPARIAVLRAFNAGQLRTTSLRETLNRQSGMYRIAAGISDGQADALIGNFCRSRDGCLRTILWKRDDEGTVPSTRLPREKFDPAYDQTGRGEKCVPLLCQEPCNLLVAACRKAVKEEITPPPQP